MKSRAELMIAKLKDINTEIKSKEAIASQRVDRLMQFLQEKELAEEFQDWLIEFDLMTSN